MSSFNWPPRGSGSGSGVSSLNTLTGALTLAAGANITITPSGGNTLTIASTGGGTPGGSDGEVQFNNAGSFGGIGDSVVSTNLLGLGTTPTVRLQVQANDIVLSAIMGLTMTPSTEVVLDNPTVITTEIVGPIDASGFTGSIVPNPSTFIADGSDWSANLYTIRIISSSNLSGNYHNTNPQNFDYGVDPNDSSQITFDTSWAAASEGDFYIIELLKDGSTVDFYLVPGDLTTNAIVLDGSQTGGQDIGPTFDSIAYNNNTGSAPAAPGGALNATQNFSETGWIADGTVFAWQLDSYQIINGIKYCSGSPVSFGTTDDNSGNPYAWDLDSWSDGGNTAGFVLRRSTDGGSTWTYQDIGYIFAYVDSDFADDGSGSFWGVTYPGAGPIVRHYDAYGESSTPSTYFSTSHASYTATDSNPAQGYVWLHTITYGTTTTGEFLGSTFGFGLTNGYLTTDPNFIDYNGFWVQAALTTPQHIGFANDGSTQTLHGYAHSTSPNYYSSTFDSASYTFPTNSDYTYFTVNWALPAGAADVKFLRDIGGGFTGAAVFSGSSFTYTSVFPSAWNASLTVTPTSIPGTAAILQNGAAALMDSPQLIIKSTASASTKIQFQDNSSTDILDFGVDSGVGYLNNPTGAVVIRKAGLNVINLTSGEVLFNGEHLSTFNFHIYNSVGSDFFTVSSQNQQVLIGTPSSVGSSGLTVYPKTSVKNLVLRQNTTGATSFVDFNNAGDTTVSRIDSDGSFDIVTTNNSNAWLNIGAGTTAKASIFLSGGGSLRTTPVNGGIEYDGSFFYFTDNAATRKLLALFASSSALSSGTVPLVDSGGHLAASQITDTGTLIVLNRQVESKLGISLDSNQNITMGSNGKIIGNFGTGEANFTTSQTLAANHIYNWTSGTVNATLPTAVGIAGRQYIISNSGTGVVTVLTTSSQTISGAASGSITLAQFHSITVISEGSNWIKVASN